MKTRYWLRLLAAGVAILAIGLFAACGGGDDDDDDDDDGGDTPFGDSTSGSGSGNTSSGSSDANPSGSEEKYVASLCKATLKFTQAMNKLNPADFSDEEKVFDVLEKPYEEFVNDLEDAKPPKELKDYHEQALKQLKALLKAIKDEDQSALESFGETELPEPPADVQARLEKAASENKDCKEANVTFQE